MASGGVVIQQPTTVSGVAAQSNANSQNYVSATRGLGITQIVLGSLTILFGIIVAAVLHYWVSSVGFGIWGGIWILVGGILGVMSAGNPANSCVAGSNLAFAIVSCIISGLNFIFYCVAITYYRHYYRYCYFWTCSYRSHSTGVALYVILLLLMIAEFVAALSAAIYCCKSNGCCGQATTPGTVIFQQTQPVVFQTGPVVSSSYPVPVSTYPAAVSTYPASTYPASTYPGQQVTYVSTMPPSSGAPIAYNQPQYDQQQKAVMTAPPPYVQ